ncbi:hypothetical protein COO59_10185 [Mixta theicola]|uniref:Fimbrial protein n=1 Tax=Mixta theicola TaxID=1458355 RepID=A0A2K1Q9Y9_9GAMM|nr:hypothetical protein [Mixta theicola]PNS11848.1 hypothetical protein COO59_10185 [Mixta theicola]GLR07776.1 hypothetical protein GCM10007905_04950 [Mixta theicola]
MKTKFILSAMTGLALSASALAATPVSYDTKFNVSANVPDSAKITDPSGRPITDMDITMTPAASGKMEAETSALKLWNNDVEKLEVLLTLDDSQAATGDAFRLYSTQGGKLDEMNYKISTFTNTGSQVFSASGDTKNYTLGANGTHGELPIVFKFVSDKNYDALGHGLYTGVVYANVVVKP